MRPYLIFVAIAVCVHASPEFDVPGKKAPEMTEPSKPTNLSTALSAVDGIHWQTKQVDVEIAYEDAEAAIRASYPSPVLMDKFLEKLRAAKKQRIFLKGESSGVAALLESVIVPYILQQGRAVVIDQNSKEVVSSILFGKIEKGRERGVYFCLLSGAEFLRQVYVIL